MFPFKWGKFPYFCFIIVIIFVQLKHFDEMIPYLRLLFAAESARSHTQPDSFLSILFLFLLIT